jgi:hypothetical protein
VKVLPATPNVISRFPSNIRLVRNPSNHPEDTSEMNSHGIYSVFNETAPGPLISSPSSGFVYARRKRSAFKGPLLHTANLMASNGLGTPGIPSDGQDGDGASSEHPRSGTRKSQIIEEEEDDFQEEDIEEVDSFSNADEADVSLDETGDVSMDNEATTSDVHSKAPVPEIGEGDATAANHKLVLAPAPDLRDSGMHPPRSSSLNLPDMQGDFSSPATGGEEETAREQTGPLSQPHGDSAVIQEQFEEPKPFEERPFAATKHEAHHAHTT